MPLKQTISDQGLIDCLRAKYGIEVVRLTLLPLGADMNASVYKAEAEDQPSYFLKLKRGHHQDIGLAVVNLLDNLGIQQVIPPVRTLDGHLTQSMDDFTLIVYPFIEGQDGFNRNLKDEQWLTLGKTLRQIHDLALPSSIKRRIRKEDYSSKWREILRSLYTHIEGKPFGDQIALKLLAFMKKNIMIIQRLVDRAEQLVPIIQNQSPQLVLCHSDIHGGNVLIDDDSIYIVDWDAPILAPKERDLMFIGGGVANVWNKAHEEALFYKGYGQIEVNMTILTYYRHERIVEDIAEYGQVLLLTTAGGENRSEMYKHFIDMFEPAGVIDIAFQTDEGLCR
ncbi:MAG: aminoglycoside phosphotransferase family protein [Tatlockia sp.]|nr:aminoglycoside phosphotransferase family protein [Tatlockia sp.]